MQNLSRQLLSEPNFLQQMMGGDVMGSVMQLVRQNPALLQQVISILAVEAVNFLRSLTSTVHVLTRSFGHNFVSIAMCRPPIERYFIFCRINLSAFPALRSRSMAMKKGEKNENVILQKKDFHETLKLLKLISLCIKKCFVKGKVARIRSHFLNVEAGAQSWLLTS